MRDCMYGDVFYARLQGKGSEQSGIRPIVIIQNNTGNKFSSTTIVAAITSNPKKGSQPTHVRVKCGDGGLSKDSTIMLEQVRTIDKSELLSYVGHFSNLTIAEIIIAQQVSMSPTASISLSDINNLFDLKAGKLKIA